MTLFSNYNELFLRHCICLFSERDVHNDFFIYEKIWKSFSIDLTLSISQNIIHNISKSFVQFFFFAKYFDIVNKRSILNFVNNEISLNYFLIKLLQHEMHYNSKRNTLNRIYVYINFFLFFSCRFSHRNNCSIWWKILLLATVENLSNSI